MNSELMIRVEGVQMQGSRITVVVLSAILIGAVSLTACDKRSAVRSESETATSSTTSPEPSFAQTPSASGAAQLSTGEISRIDSALPLRTCQDANSQGDSFVDASLDLVVGPAAFVGARTITTTAGLINRYGADGIPSAGAATVSFKIATMVENGSRVVIRIAASAVKAYSLSSSSAGGEAVEFAGCPAPAGGYTAWASSFILHEPTLVCLPLLVTNSAGRTYVSNIPVGGSTC